MLNTIQNYLFFIFISAQLLAGTQAPTAGTTESGLYFESHSMKKKTYSCELQPSFGYVFSHPYLHIVAGSLDLLYQTNSYIALGAGFSSYTYSRRSTLDDLETELKDFGFNLKMSPPRWGSALIFRLTPISNLTNLFSKGVFISDLSLSLRTGFTRYSHQNVLFSGALLEILFSISEKVGLSLGWNWDVEWNNQGKNNSRIGFRLGPSIKF